MKRTLVTAALLLPALLAQAQPTQWTSFGMGGGGAFYSPNISPQNAKQLYVASDMSDVFHSTDGGASWSLVDFRTLQGGSLAGDIQFTNSPLIQYTIDNTGEQPHPVKTLDGGATWAGSIADPTHGNAWRLIADPYNSNHVLVADDRRLYLSVTGGNTFQAIDSSSAAFGFRLAGACFSGTTICVGSNQGVIVSTDGGASFTRVTAPGIGANEAIVSFTGAIQGLSARLFCVTMNASDVSPDITGAQHGSYRNIYTLDFGASATWTARGSALPTSVHPFFVGMSPANVNVAYVAGGSAGGSPTVYKTSDGGQTWNAVFQTTNNQNIITGWSGDGGDRNWSYGEYALGFTVSAADVNTAMISDLGFVHITTDGGQTWRQVYVNPADQNPAGSTTPTGKSYRGVGLENTSCWRLEWIDSLSMIGCYTDIRGTISTDGGATWSQNYTGHNLNTMYHAVYSAAKLTTYAATSSRHDLYQSTTIYDNKIDAATGQVLASTDRGHTWTIVHDFGHPVVWLALDPTNSNRLYASVVSSTAGGIYVTSDVQNGAGSSWTRLTPPPRTEGHAFNIRVLNDGGLVCTYSARKPTTATAFTQSSGVFYSTDHGTTWLDRSDAAMKYWTNDVVIDPHDAAQRTWYAGVFSGWGGPPNGLGGLYRTTDRGVSWTKINATDRVTSCTVHPIDPDVMYVTTETNGLLYTKNLSAATPVFTPLAGYPFRQPERVFFNPFNAGEVWVSSFGYGICRSNAIPPPPSAPMLVAPVDGTTGVHLRDTLFWSASAGAAHYHLQISRDTGFTQIVADTNGVIATRFVLHDMTYNAQYSWRVAAVGQGGAGEWSEPWSFRMERLTLPLPRKVILDRPADHEQLVGMPNRFVWYPTLSSIDRYELQLSTDAGFATMQSDTSITDTSATVTTWTIPIREGDYFWRVRGHNLAGWGPFSDPRSYTMMTISVNEPRLAPVAAALQPVAPNPFTDAALVRVHADARTQATVRVFDVLGRCVREIFSGMLDAGDREFTLRAGSLPLGTFLVRLATPRGETVRMVVKE